MLTNFEFLFLYKNPILKGIIPTNLGQLQAIQNIFLLETEDSCSIVSEIEKLGKLVKLNLSLNKFSGSIPINIGSLLVL